MPKRRYRKPPEILSQPIKAYEFPANERAEKIDAEVTKRITAAFEYFGIDDGPFKWEMLSLVQLLRTFPAGFTVLNEPRGGAKKNPEDAYCELADKFDRYIAAARRKNPHLTHTQKVYAKPSSGRD